MKEIRQNSEELKAKIDEVVRIIPLCLISVQQLRDILNSTTENTDFSSIELTHCVLAQKSSLSLTSHGLLMPPGGEIQKGESLDAAASRKLASESLIHGVEGDWWKDKDFFQAGPAFQYKIIGKSPKKDEMRNEKSVRFLPRFILPVELSKAIPRDVEQDKIENFPTFSPSQLEEFITNGKLETDKAKTTNQTDGVFIPAGHFTLQASDDIKINEEEGEKKKTALIRVIEQVHDFDNFIRDQLLKEVNLIRLRRQQPVGASINDFSQAEIIDGFQILHIRLALQHDNFIQYRNAQVVEDEKQANEILKPPPGMDVLKMAWLLSGEGMETQDLANLLFLGTTQNSKRNIVRLAKSFRDTFIVEEGWSKPDFKEKNALEFLQQKLSGIPSDLERREYMEKLNIEFMRKFAAAWGADVATIEEVSKDIDDFFPYLVGQSMQVHPDISKRYQAYNQLDELTNAGLIRVFLLALDVNPAKPNEQLSAERKRQLRFEAARKLALLGRGIEAKVRYRELVKNRNAPLHYLLSSLFTAPFEDEERDIGESKVVFSHRRTEKAIGANYLHVITDLKPLKPFISFLRKSFFEPLEKIRDVYSRNIVLAEDADEDSGDTNRLVQQSGESFQQYALRRVEMAKMLKSAIQEYINEQIKLYGIKTVEDLRGRKSVWWTADFDGKDSFRQLARPIEELENEEATGKRPGSKGDKIIRTKFYAHLTKFTQREGSDSIEEDHHYEEISIYPVQTFVGTPFEGMLWGYEEKLADDTTGGYNFRRLIERDPDYPEIPSLYEILYPPHIYAALNEPIYVEKTDQESTPLGKLFTIFKRPKAGSV